MLLAFFFLFCVFMNIASHQESSNQAAQRNDRSLFDFEGEDLAR
jgi:hypothetical protein